MPCQATLLRIRSLMTCQDHIWLRRLLTKRFLYRFLYAWAIMEKIYANSGKGVALREAHHAFYWPVATLCASAQNTQICTRDYSQMSNHLYRKYQYHWQRQNAGKLCRCLTGWHLHLWCLSHQRIDPRSI